MNEKLSLLLKPMLLKKCVIFDELYHDRSSEEMICVIDDREFEFP